MSEPTIDALTKKVEILKQEAIIATSKEREALYNFKTKRWSALAEIANQFFYFACWAVLVGGFFGACAYGCTQPDAEEVLATKGLRAIHDGWGNRIIEKIPEVSTEKQ